MADFSVTESLAGGASERHTLVGHASFMAFAMMALMLLFSLARVALYGYNAELASSLSRREALASFGIGLRFDLMVTSILCLPLLAGFLWPASRRLRGFLVGWLSVASSLAVFLCITELDFYREFHQRLNSLVLEYLRQDPRTVISMLWNGFPLFRYLLLWLLLSWLVYRGYRLLDRLSGVVAQRLALRRRASPILRLPIFVVVLLALVLGARGTLRQGPPLRWGDAFHSQNLFANHLGLNGIFTLYKASRSGKGKTDRKYWLRAMPLEKATAMTRRLLFTAQDTPAEHPQLALLRTHGGNGRSALAGASGLNVVVILMESFSGVFSGALGSTLGITPEFDRLAGQGLLFTRFFSNGTHTHQGMFATLACFPNLPGHEYLMQQQEGLHRFSGLPQLLRQKGYQDLYVYNGSFSWDNQEGFFRNQGMTRFIGRDDFIDPVFVDPTWGVSDQDMFARAADELEKLPRDKPFFAVLQTLSNHTPYALPDPLPVPPVSGQGKLDDHLTAMRYADWALGRFFRRVERQPWYANTLFVVLGDHGFGVNRQLTDIDLLRFHVPLLLIGPGVRETYGATIDRVATQNDVAPTVMGLLGEAFTHQCWGRDVLSVSDPGLALIKPSGNDEIVGLLRDDRIVVRRPGAPPDLYRYTVGPNAHAEKLDDEALREQMALTLAAFVQRAMQSLLDDTAGLAP